MLEATRAHVAPHRVSVWDAFGTQLVEALEIAPQQIAFHPGSKLHGQPARRE